MSGARPWWRPRDWVGKVLWTGLFVALGALALAVAWTEPLGHMYEATVVDAGPVPADGSAAVYAGRDVAQYPFLKQSIERAEEGGGSARTLLPEAGWDAWVEHVRQSQPLADPALVAYRDRAWRFTFE